MITAMITTISATMMMIIRGLLIMCRSMPNLVPSGSKSPRIDQTHSVAT